MTEEQFQRAATARQELKRWESAVEHSGKGRELQSFVEDCGQDIPAEMVEEFMAKARAHFEKQLRKARREFKRI